MMLKSPKSSQMLDDEGEGIDSGDPTFEICPRMEAQYPRPMPQETDANEDRRLISGVLAKDRKATAEFVTQCADWIYPFVRRRLVPRAELVEDLMQEILFAAWQALPDYRGEANLRSWVMGIARHKLEDYYRKKIHQMEISEEDECAPERSTIPVFEQQLDSIEQMKKVQRTLALLPEAYALALIWQYRDEKSVREMANGAGQCRGVARRRLPQRSR